MVRFNMKLLTLLILWFRLARGQEQQTITVSLPHDPTPNIIDSISTNQPFHQYSFKPQTIPISYPPPTVLPIKPPEEITIKQTSTIQPQSTVSVSHQKQLFNPNPTIQPYSQVISTNIPVQARYRVADYGLISAAAQAYPVQHSVEINHGDYIPYQHFFIQQHLEPISKDQNPPPITRPIHPNFDRPLTQQKQLKPYSIPPGNNQVFAKPPQQQKYIPLNINLNTIPTNSIKPQQPYNSYIPANPNINSQRQRIRQHIQPNRNQNVNQARYTTPQQFSQTTAPNLPHNFKPVQVHLQPYQTQVQNPSQVKLLPVPNSIPALPKPLPSPFSKNIPISPRPLPIPVSVKPTAITHVEGKPVREQNNEEEQEEKRPSKEEEKEEKEDEKEERDEEKEEEREQEREEEREEEKEEEGSEEEEEEEGEEDEEEDRDYRPRYSHNYHKYTDFDRRRYRPTFDAARYIFNDYSEEDEGGESEEEDESEERQPNSSEERSRERENETYRRRERHHKGKPRRSEKGRRPHQKRVRQEKSEESEDSKESREAKVEETRRRPHSRKYRRRPYYYYYRR